MADQTGDEAKNTNIEKMGETLGALYSALWQAVATIHFHWQDYVELFGTNPERITLLNNAAPAFFRMIQDELWEMSLLHLARLTDPTNSLGRNNKQNLTIQALPILIDDATLKGDVANLVDHAVRQTAFCRDWRNRRIAHRDLKLALNDPTTPLADASRAQVNNALKAISDVLNALAAHYLKSETRFDLAARHTGSLGLLYLIDDGLRAREQRAKRLEAGKPTEEDLVIRRL
jgi:hypothetical protein